MDDSTPISYLALEIGTAVKSSSGHIFGKVAHVLQIPEEDLFDGIVVSTENGLRFVDRDQIVEMTQESRRLFAERRPGCRAAGATWDCEFPRRYDPGHRPSLDGSIRPPLRSGAVGQGQVKPVSPVPPTAPEALQAKAVHSRSEPRDQLDLDGDVERQLGEPNS